MNKDGSNFSVTKLLIFFDGASPQFDFPSFLHFYLVLPSWGLKFHLRIGKKNRPWKDLGSHISMPMLITYTQTIR